MELRKEEMKKRTYTSPRLLVHGNVEKITWQVGKGSADGLGGQNTRS